MSNETSSLWLHLRFPSTLRNPAHMRSDFCMLRWTSIRRQLQSYVGYSERERERERLLQECSQTLRLITAPCFSPNFTTSTITTKENAHAHARTWHQESGRFLDYLFVAKKGKSTSTLNVDTYLQESWEYRHDHEPRHREKLAKELQMPRDSWY